MIAERLAPRMGGVTERGLKALESIEHSGLTLLEVKVNPYSPVRCRQLSSLALPHPSRALCLIRQGQVFHDMDGLFLEEDDRVVILTRDVTQIRELFTGWQWEEVRSGTRLAV